MADAPTLSPEVSRSVSALARSLATASRGSARYSADHPAVGSPLERVRGAVAEANGVQIIDDRDGGALEEMALVYTWEPDGRGKLTWAVVEAVDPQAAKIDPPQQM